MGLRKAQLSRATSVLNCFSPFESSLGNLKKKQEKALTLFLHLDVVIPLLGVSMALMFRTGSKESWRKRMWVRLGFRVFPLRHLWVRVRVCGK